MSDLPMPSDVRKDAQVIPARQSTEPIEPPSVKLIVRLFLIPLVIVAIAVGVMFLIGLMAGSEPSFDEAMTRLRSAGGERTANYLVGPASKQRYLDAKALADKMKEGMTASERVLVASQLIDIIDNHTSTSEGEVQHVLLLTLGRVWQQAPGQSAMNSPEAVESRQKVASTLLKYADSDSLPTRKAAILAMVYLAGQDQASGLIPRIIQKLEDPKEDIDVRIAAATVLGPMGTPQNKPIIDALNIAMHDTAPREAELVWSSALSLAELNQADVADTILKLLDRDELSKLQYYDREKDPRNPAFRTLSDQEQQRILINTMLGAKKLEVPAVQAQLKKLAASDPSPRVRAAGMEILGPQ
jgi:hypothetical protein